jgi:hypothetical protein
MLSRVLRKEENRGETSGGEPFYGGGRERERTGSRESEEGRESVERGHEEEGERARGIEVEGASNVRAG